MPAAMRIIAGKYRGRRLKSPPSFQTRPTSDRLRETLFNIIVPRIEGARFLDLCAGSGAVGIEALSRGAAHVTFVDQSRKMCALIEANLRGLGIDEEQVDVVNSEAQRFLQQVVRKQRNPSLTAPPQAGFPLGGPGVGLLPRSALFDIVFFDPPYAADYEAVLNYAADHPDELLVRDGVMVVEHHKNNEFPEGAGRLQRYRVLKQGDSSLSFYRPAAA